MILSFSVRNFRSFCEEQTLSLVAEGKQPDHPDHLNAIPDDEEKALPVAVIYGANGAGKSNLVKAMGFLKSLVLGGTEPKKSIPRKPFLLDKESAAAATEIQIQLVEDGRVYAFGCRLTDKFILAEWLSLLRNGKELSVYERATTEAGDVRIEAGPVLKDDTWGNHEKVYALTKVGVLPNQLFLHSVSKSLQEQDQGPVLAGLLRWFSERLTVIRATSEFHSLARLIAHDATFTDFAGEFLKNIATGVDRLHVESVEIEEGMLPKYGPHFEKLVEQMSIGDLANVSEAGENQMTLEKGEGSRFHLRKLEAEHKAPDGTVVKLPFSEESDGTQRVTHLLPALHSISNKKGVFVIDEIDRSLHPLLAKGFVRAFLNACAGHGSQLIFTTHDTTFLDLSLLRRDEIWFVNKSLPGGASELYSLSDYKVRTDLKIDKAYLEGRFEAVPPIEQELPDWVRGIIDELRPRQSPAKAEQ